MGYLQIRRYCRTLVPKAGSRKIANCKIMDDGGPEQGGAGTAVPAPAPAPAAQAANGIPAFVPGGGPSRPGEGWAHVKVLRSADMKASWECNFCKKVVAGENH